MENPLDFAVRTAKQAGDLLQSYFRQGSITASLKSDHSVVTEADLAADHLIARAIRKAFPEDSILSEELQPALQPVSGQVVWVVDPLDGTTNFSLGLQIWGVSIARISNGYCDVAALHFPMLGETYTAQTGHGAALNGERLALNSAINPHPASFFSCCSRTFRNYQVSIPYKPRILGSAAYSFCTVSRGSALVVFDATPKIWDIAAAWLVVEEAGGIIETYDGIAPFPLRPGVNYESQVFTTLAAATPELAVQARRQIRPINQKS